LKGKIKQMKLRVFGNVTNVMIELPPGWNQRSKTKLRKEPST